MLHAKRNIIKEDTVQGVHLVIKSFKRIYLPNRIRYTYFASSKAQRAFDNAHILTRLGFTTPRPIAYIEITRDGLITEMYFVSEYTDFVALDTMRQTSLEDARPLLLQLAQHTYKLHQTGVYHIDYNLENILFRKHANGQFELSLIDNNRMKFGEIRFEDGIQNFERLGLSAEHLTLIGQEYARLSNVPEVIAIERLFYYKRRQLDRRLRKKALKEILAGLKNIRQISGLARTLSSQYLAAVNFTTSFVLLVAYWWRKS